MTLSQEGLSIVVPCFNEQGSVAELARRIAALAASLPAPFELVLVDDGSRDDTWREIQHAAQEYAFVVPVRHDANAGLVAGWRSGLAASQGRYVVTLDADLQYRPEDIVTLFAQIKERNADLIQGARVVEIQRSPLRRFLTNAFSVFLNLLFGMRLKDNKSGFILYRREVMSDVLAGSEKFIHFQHFVAVAAHAKGYRLLEVPIVFDPRFAGQSYIRRPLRFALQALRDLPRALWHYRLARPRRSA